MNKIVNEMGFIGLALLFFFNVFACTPEDDEETIQIEKATTQDTNKLPPVETNPPNTNYSPAFKGQTRVAGVKTNTMVVVSEFAQGLNRPWGMANLPDGRIIVSEKGGTLKIVDQSGTISNAITGLPAVNSYGQGGLLDIAVDPAFTTNRMLYWTYSRDMSNGTATALAKGRLSNDESKVENVSVIYTALPQFNGTNHYGSRIEWTANGNFFVSTGERYTPRDEAQALDAALGKVLRITTDGNAVATNPFVNNTNALDEIYSYGHRNPQGLATHPITGDLWVIEHGPRGGDEVNRVQAGKNYGWPVISYGIEYGGPPIGTGITQKPGMEQPVYYWDPSIAPCGSVFYSGGLIAEWDNNLFVTALAGQHLVRLVIENNRVVGEERLLEGRARLRDVLQGKDGGLYVLEDGSNAKLYRIGL